MHEFSKVKYSCNTRSSLRAIIDIHAGVEQGHGEREPGAREGGEGEVGVEDAEPLHRGVTQGHRLLRACSSRPPPARQSGRHSDYL